MRASSLYLRRKSYKPLPAPARSPLCPRALNACDSPADADPRSIAVKADQEMHSRAVEVLNRFVQPKPRDVPVGRQGIEYHGWPAFLLERRQDTLLIRSRLQEPLDEAEAKLEFTAYRIPIRAASAAGRRARAVIL